MQISPWRNGLIHLVSGKGGVGKSTYAAALSLHLAQQGQRTLLVELGDRSFQRYVFQVDVGYEPVAVQSHLSLALWDGETCLRDYLLYLLKVDRVVSLFFDNKVMRALVQAAPALKELAILGKLTSRERKVGPTMPFDAIVVDAYATGHFRALWRAPIGMAEAIPFGPMGEQSNGMIQVIMNPRLTRIHIVTTAEELAVQESLELARDVQAELNQQPHFVLNRTLATDLTLEQLQPFAGNEFVDYVSLLLSREKRSRELISSRNLLCSELPWELVGSPQEKIRRLSQQGNLL